MTSPHSQESRRRVTTRELVAMKERGERIAILTCYDHLFARLLDASGVDVVLVGDSLGQVILGYDSTLPVTLEAMIHHASAVRRGVTHALVVVDLPFLSYQVSDEEALRSAGRIMKETGAEAVKLEGGDEAAVSRVQALVRAGIPVMGHLGLTPQSVHSFGGYGVRGREPEEATRLRRQAAALEEAGCFAIVLELMPTGLARDVSQSLRIPTIGIGAGPDCDGQVLVLPDMLGLNEGFEPRFLRRFGALGPAVHEAVDAYVEAVRERTYPDASESYDG
ncbi:MAG: 3-methyl-2-oxobutanoate hydroxymethyltransferase [Candidatus Palauibacterales bacterium]|nr:3-methyl-2-oxobutanoate hydroxymethyltransferase [Candidatus Palauibacterales bacterium]MDP2529492.1 3-methyl-2-oxobutanoate hydroxymethyltransferase [Candidatus Palauibacterales bacterium]MDP2585160.1 3-methyl-2-oxobutanoate hydroxymethyltransferase [Candidatus Palauibacterales bacterium]